MVEEYARPLSPEEQDALRRSIEPLRPRGRALSAIPPERWLPPVVGLGTLAVIAAAGGSRGGLAIALTAGLLWSGYHLIAAARQRTRQRHFAEAHRKRRRVELEKILQHGMARVKRVKAVSVVELAAFEDEGPGYVFDLRDGRVLFVKGQDFASPDDDAPWPNTEFEIVRAGADGTMLGLRCHGALLRPMRVIPASIVDPQKGWQEREDVLQMSVDQAVRSVLL